MREEITNLIVKVHPGSAKPRIEYRQGELHAYTSKKPARGEANSDVIRLISEYFKVPKKQIELIKGAKSRNKLYSIRRVFLTQREKSRGRGL